MRTFCKLRVKERESVRKRETDRRRGGRKVDFRKFDTGVEKRINLFLSLVLASTAGLASL